MAHPYFSSYHVVFEYLALPQVFTFFWWSLCSPGGGRDLVAIKEAEGLSFFLNLVYTCCPTFLDPLG